MPLSMLKSRAIEAQKEECLWKKRVLRSLLPATPTAAKRPCSTPLRAPTSSSATGPASRWRSGTEKLSVSDRIGRVVTNRILALPIFAAVMFLVYWIAMGPFGSFLTDWTNDVLGGEWLEGGTRALMESVGAANWLTGLISDGIFHGVGNFIASIFRPLGFGSWKPAVATVTGLVAKEEVVSTFGILYNYDDQDGEEELEENGDQIWDRVAEDFSSFSGGHGRLSAFAFMIFNLLCAPCFAAMGAIKQEMNSPRWTWFAIGYMCVFAYAVALIVNQLGRLFAGAMNIPGLVAAIALLVIFAYMLFIKKYQKADRLTVK